MAGILVFADFQNGQLQATSFELAAVALEAARSAGASVRGALIGASAGEQGGAFDPKGIASVLVADHSVLSSYDGDAFVAAAEALIRHAAPELVIFPQTSETSEWVPRLAARMDAALVTGCSGVKLLDGHFVATKANCGGAFLADYVFDRPLKMAMLAVGGSVAAERGSNVVVERVEFAVPPRRVELLETVVEDAGDGPSLKTAKVVVSGGIGVGSAENWKYIEQAAAGIGAAVGASRAAVDMGWVPSTRQVGFSGLKVNADLYIAAGISGAIHHLAGLGRVKNVVAINEDREASIFSVARYGVVGDLKEVLPAFVARVNELKAQ